MQMVSKNSLYTLFITTLVFMWSACVDERQEKRGENRPDGYVRISVDIPPSSPPRGDIIRATQTLEESRITEIQVLVFENDMYSYVAQGERIVHSNGSASFLAKLRSSDVPTTIYLIANNNTLVSNSIPAPGTPINQLTSLFNLVFTTAGVSGNVALWGSYSFENGIPNTLEDISDPIPLLRAAARVDVEVAASVTNFTLTSIQVFRASNTIQLIPNSLNAYNPVSYPSIPAGNQNNVNTPGIPTTSAILSEEQIYLPESAAPSIANQISQATCIVVGGRFNSSVNPTFYRLDFNPQISNHPLGQVLRNHRYLFTITSVAESGQTTALAAANSASSNMDASLVVWPNDDVRYMFFNKLNHFGLSDLEVGVHGNINSTAEITVATNLATYSWRFGTAGTWTTGTLNNGIFSLSRANSNQTIVVTGLTNNFGNTNNQQIVQIQATGLPIIDVLVVQPPTVPNLEWASRNVGATGQLVSNIQDFGGIFQWNRPVSFPANGGTTTPPGWSSGVSASLNWEVVNNPCPTGWRVPTNQDWIVFRLMYPGRSLRPTGTLLSPGNGIWFAPTQAAADAATFANPGSAIFLPSAGWSGTDGQHHFGSNTAEFGFYWAANRTTTGFRVLRIADGTQIIYAVSNSSGYSLRCVRDL